MTADQGNVSDMKIGSRTVVAESGNTGGEAPRASEAPRGRGFRKTREGHVVSDKMNKTVVVAIEDRFRHPLYGKIVRRTSKLTAHDEQNACRVGDRVLVMETRPLSKTKRWRVVEVVEKAK
jgi:small subunit ribosomal protein S17